MAEKNLAEKRNITPEIAVKILRDKGIEVDEIKAAEILDFLYFLAKLTVNQYIKEQNKISKNHEDSGSLCEGEHR